MRHRLRRTPPMGVTATLLFGAMVIFGSSTAQRAPSDVSEVLPSTTIAAFYAAPASAGWGVLAEIVDALDLDTAKDTVSRLIAVASNGSGVGTNSVDGMLDPYLDDLEHDCPELARLLRADGLEGLYGPSVVAISVSPFNPFPGAIAVARPNDATFAAEVQDAVIACAGSDLTLQEGDVTLHVVGDGSDLPLVLARVDGLFLAATDPELARTALRLAAGSTEPRFVDGPIGREAAALMGEGLGLALDLDALADALESLRGMVPAGSEADALADRFLATLRTVGGFAARATIDEAGVRLDSVLSVDPAAGDVELATLLACEACRPGEPRLIPSGALSLQGRVFSPVALVAWLDGWIGAVGDMMGEPLDLRSLALEFAAVDLDRGLLDWVGSTWHMAQLEPLGTDVRGWVTGPGTITTVPVTSEAAAWAGLADWKQALETLPLLLGDGMGVGPLGALVGPTDAAAGGLLSVREVEYRGVRYERWRIGPTIDLAVTVLDAHLVLAVPAYAMRSVIDVHHGAPDVRGDQVLAGALAALPADATGYDVFDVARGLRALATVSDFIAAPAASALALVIVDADRFAFRDDGYWEEEWEWDDAWNWDDASGGLTGLGRAADRFGADPLASSDAVAGTLTVPGFVTATISVSDRLTSDDLGLVFDLSGLRVGDLVQIVMLDPSPYTIDTFLYLFDVDAGRVIADNDDAPDTSRSEIIFEVEPETRYAVIASSWSGRDIGTITIETAVIGTTLETPVDAQSEAEPEPEAEPETMAEPEPESDVADEYAEDAPSVTFDEVVGLFDLVTAFLEELAARSDVASGWSVVEDGVSRSTLRIPLR
jgi:hypothetical protein